MPMPGLGDRLTEARDAARIGVAESGQFQRAGHRRAQDMNGIGYRPSHFVYNLDCHISEVVTAR